MTDELRRGLHTLSDFLFIAVFTYAAMTKVIAPVDFGVKLLKAHYIPTFLIPAVTALIPLSEIAAVVFIMFGKFTRLGWEIIYILMICFDVHLAILHLVAPAAPCSCGGLLESISFGQHMIFNALLTLIAAVRLVSWKL
ncbi:MAG: hypothetical protein P8X57_02195 [Cyclobacteriaceae bacterium]